ncbi:C40 family peptidase [Pengzhenrongella sicca]|uniref:C40 family peptidase n=1 Tax=Pengzhenrongella sicca TaxID=2819238 RepID=A0A8A4ZD82_9MICO|nr:C40 family peptidase [Pengzhenrongella sicca]QTE29874.1 C40 family peptidase [Pengzhenrongella sicca]
MTAITEIQGRIGEIQAAMQTLRTGATQTSATTSASAAAALAAATTESSTSFADALAALTGTGATATATTGDTTAGSTTATGASLVAAAGKYVGVPYVWGGEDPATGLDCSGLVQRAMADLGIDVPRVAKDQAKLGTAVASLDEAKAGDLLVFDGGSHIGIYVGDGRMIDAPKPGKSVAVRDVFETPTAIRRVLPEASAPTADTSTVTTTADLQRYALTMMSQRVAA